jgi:hypothetical protein
MVLKIDTVAPATERERCRIWWWVTPSCEVGFVSSSTGNVLLVSVARNGATQATGAAKRSRLVKQQITGLARSEASAESDRFNLMPITI